MGAGARIAKAGPVSGFPERARRLWSDLAGSWIARSLLGAILIELVWGLGAGVRVGLSTTLFVQMGVPAFVALFCRLTGWLPVVGSIAEAVFIWTMLAIVGAPLTYLAARAEFPLRDPFLRAADLALGFDGLRWQAWVRTMPYLNWALGVAYGSMGLQILFCCILFGFTREMWRFRELFWIAWISLVLTCLISAVVPAEGISARYAHYAPAWREHLMLLRTGRPVLAELGSMRGIVFFPSYHTVMAIAFTYANRRSGIVTWFMAALNGLMLLSTFSQGDHYLVDVLAGAAVTMGVILLVDHFDLARSRRTER